jgi:SulP family sulfate permease
MLLGILFSSLFAFELLGVHVVGEIPAGLAPPKLPGLSLDQWLLLLPAALGLALVNFAEDTVGVSFLPGTATNRRDRVVGLGAANLGAGLFKVFDWLGLSNGANARAGAKTPVALIVCAS